MNNDISNTDYNFSPSQALVGGQMLFVAFGALVLVPLLTGLDPSVALFTAGVGTLIFQLVTKGKVPIFLASSFAFIAPIQVSVAEWGISSTMSGLAAAGLLVPDLQQVDAGPVRDAGPPHQARQIASRDGGGDAARKDRLAFRLGR